MPAKKTGPRQKVALPYHVEETYKTRFKVVDIRWKIARPIQIAWNRVYPYVVPETTTRVGS